MTVEKALTIFSLENRKVGSILAEEGRPGEERLMLESTRKAIAIHVPRLPMRAALSVGTVASFTWLLTQDLIHPFVIYLLQLYLAF